MELNDKVTQLEDEIKILKNEIQSVLLDLRVSFLNNENPFNARTYTMPSSPPAPSAPVSLENEEDNDSEISLPEEIQEPEIPDDDPLDSLNDTIYEELNKLDTDGEMRMDSLDIGDLIDDVQMPRFVPGSRTNGNGMHRETDKILFQEPEVKQYSGVSVAVEEDKLDMDTIEKISGWVDSSVDRLGPDRTRTMLDVCETMGYIHTPLKNLMAKFIHPDSINEAKNVTTKDYLASLVELNHLLKGENKMEVALLFFLILFQEYDNR